MLLLEKFSHTHTRLCSFCFGCVNFKKVCLSLKDCLVNLEQFSYWFILSAHCFILFKFRKMLNTLSVRLWKWLFPPPLPPFTDSFCLLPCFPNLIQVLELFSFPDALWFFYACFERFAVSLSQWTSILLGANALQQNLKPELLNWHSCLKLPQSYT